MEAGSAVEKNDVECSGLGLGYKQATVATATALSRGVKEYLNFMAKLLSPSTKYF